MSKRKFNERSSIKNANIPVKRVLLDEKLSKGMPPDTLQPFENGLFIPDKPYPVLKNSRKATDEAVLHISLDNPKAPKNFTLSFSDGTTALKERKISIASIAKKTALYLAILRVNEVKNASKLHEMASQLNVNPDAFANAARKKAINEDMLEGGEALAILIEPGAIAFKNLQVVGDFSPEFCIQIGSVLVMAVMHSHALKNAVSKSTKKRFRPGS